MRKRWIAWAMAAVVAVGGMTWGQTAWSADPAVQTVDAAVTPKIVLPLSPGPIEVQPSSSTPAPLPPPVVTAAQNNRPIQPTQSARKTWFDLMPADQGVVQVGAQMMQKSSLHWVGATSRFVPALRPNDARPAVPLVGTTEPPATGPVLVTHLEPATPGAPPDPTAPISPSVPSVSQDVPPTPVTAPPAPQTVGQSVATPGCCCSTCGHASGGPPPLTCQKPALHPLLAWFTYCPKACCTHPFGPAPYEPPIYTFFLCNGHGCAGPAPCAHATP